MAEHDDGGSAFPASHGGEGMSQGMSLRDYFAAKALQGFAANSDLAQLVNGSNVTSVVKSVADYSYRWSDAMLEARKAD